MSSGQLAAALDERAQKQPEFNVLIFENGTHPPEYITYRDIVQKGRAMARLWLASDIKPGETVALIAYNHPEFVYSLYAASHTGITLVPIDPRASADNILYQLTDCQSQGVIFSNQLYEKIAPALEKTHPHKLAAILYKDGFDSPQRPHFPALHQLLQQYTGTGQLPAGSGSFPLEIIYTSGTTGRPKGVSIKEERLMLYVMLARMVWQYKPDDILYTGLSLTHGNAQAVTLIPALYLGLRAVISRRFTKSRIWDICRQFGCTSFSLLGGMMMGIYSEPPRPDDVDNPVRLVISAGTPRPIWLEFERRFGVQIHEWYGAVEGGFAHKPPGIGPVGSFGKPLEQLMEMKVVREDDSECAPGEIGELVSRLRTGPTTVEYHGNPEASAAKTRGGWLRSGDMCYRDEQGWFYFAYRKGGGLRRQGEFIQPEEVEKVLAEHPAVCDVCVYGVPAASGAPGESDLVAAVVFFPGQAIEPPELFSYCRQHLSANCVPSYIQVVEQIPKSASEKNLDRLLRETFCPAAPNIFKREG